MTLIELILSFGLFSLLLVILTLSLTDSSKMWLRVAGKADAEFQLRKAVMRMRQDLLATDISQIKVGTGTPSVWFLSNSAPPVLHGPNDSTTYVAQYNTDGTPRWQREILYYLIKPANHDAYAGMSCPGSTSDSSDSVCPHKLLIREEIDQKAPAGTDPTNAFVAQTLSDPTTFLTAPTGTNVAPLVTGTVVKSEVVAINLLSMNVTLGPPADAREVIVDLRAVRLADAAHNIAIGTSDLSTSRYTTQYPLAAVPEN
jgi:hypothetical protein